MGLKENEWKMSKAAMMRLEAETAELRCCTHTLTQASALEIDLQKCENESEQRSHAGCVCECVCGVSIHWL